MNPEYKRMHYDEDRGNNKCLVCECDIIGEKGDVHKKCARRARVQEEWDDRKWLRKWEKKYHKGRYSEQSTKSI